MQCAVPIVKGLGAKSSAPARPSLQGKNAFFAQRHPSVQRQRILIRSMASESPEGQYKDGVRCYMTKEGALVCERLPAGNYRLEAADPRTHEESGVFEEAPRCDPNRPEDCLTYCYVMEDGSMVCEGLPAGEYQIKTAGPEDVERMVQHALALEKGLTYKDLSSPATPAAEEKKSEGILGKIMGLFRSS